MRLLLKWLRPDTVPPPSKKHLPFGTKLRLDVYRSMLKLLAREYPKYAFSDTVSLPSINAKLTHEFRDTSFEAELKRLRLLQKDQMVLRDESVSTVRRRRNNLLFFKQFRFIDLLILEVDGQKVTIRRDEECSFSASRGGKLKESEVGSLLSQYQFTGPAASKQMSRSIATPEAQPKGGGQPAPKTGGEKQETPRKEPRKGPLFGDDPLFRKKGLEHPEGPATPAGGEKPAGPEKPAGGEKPAGTDKPAGPERPFGKEKPFVPPKPATPPETPVIKRLPAVDIDESF